jgi:hypothetical protein
MHGDSLQRIGIKVFVTASEGIRMRDFVPVFHSWIQKQCLEDHLLIDVHDYSHIHEGPGILLVGHEANISMDMAEGRLGLLYHRKQPLAGPLKDRLAAILRAAQHCCSMLEREASFEAKLRFGAGELLVIANDRLLAPNDSATLSSLQADLSAAFEPLLGRVFMTLANKDPKDRFSVHVRTTKNDGQAS